MKSDSTAIAESASLNTPEWRKEIHDEAIKLAKLGFRVFPLRRLGKASISPHFCHHAASNSLKTVSKWFDPVSGSYAGYNLGIATGGSTGVLVVDLDRKKDEKKGEIIDGVRTLADLEEQHGELLSRAMVSKTPSGGNHLFLKWDSGLPHGQNVLAKGIDVRSGSVNSSSGHVVVHPSVVGGGHYSWIAGPVVIDDLQLPPRWTLVRTKEEGALEDRPNWVQSNGSGNEKVGDNDLLTRITENEAVTMLEAIPPQQLSYDDWIRIGRSIHQQWPGEDGLKMWDSWSAQDSSRYREGDCSRRWAGFTGGRVTIGTLVWMAKEHGWKGGPRGELLAALERINEETPGIIIKGKERWILMDDDEGPSFMTREAAKLYHATNRVNVGDEVDPKWVNPLLLWDSWAGRLLYRKILMAPPPLRCPDNTYNLWNGFAYEPRKGNVNPWLQFVEQIIPSQEDREWVHDWLAFMFQNPGTKPTTSIVMRGEEGIGKNTFSDTIGMLFHQSNWTQFEDTDQALSQFNSQMISTIWLVMNEALWSGNHKHVSKLKGIITEPRISIELKGVDKFMTHNCAHAVIMTNEDWAVPAGLKSRRFAVIDVPPVLRGKSDFWARFRKWRDSDDSGKQALMYWYTKRKITHNLHVVPEGSALNRQRVMTQARNDNNMPLEVISVLIGAGAAAKHEGGGQWSDCWFWPNRLIRETWSSITGRNSPSNAPSKVRAMLNLLMNSDHPAVHVGSYSSSDQKVRSTYGVMIPSTPSELVALMESNEAVKPGDIDFEENWEDLPRQNW
jgi:hypothetical protein